MTTAWNGSTAAAVVGRAAMRGDRDALERLWQEHRRWIAAVILAHRSSADDLEDILQEVAMTLVAKASTIRDQANIRAWLRTVAVNAARAAGRTRRAKPSTPLDTNAGSIPIPQFDGDALESMDFGRRIMALAARLPEAYREPLLLKAVHGMRTRQIATILELPEATVDTRISRARRMLRELAEAKDEAVFS